MTSFLSQHYNPGANFGDGSCLVIHEGCLDTASYMYRALANQANDALCLCALHSSTATYHKSSTYEASSYCE